MKLHGASVYFTENDIYRYLVPAITSKGFDSEQFHKKHHIVADERFHFGFENEQYALLFFLAVSSTEYLYAGSNK